MEWEDVVRVGIVSAIDGRRVRARYDDSGITSGWLHVVQRGREWIPAINERVLVLYIPVFNGDGFVLGGL